MTFGVIVNEHVEYVSVDTSDKLPRGIAARVRNIAAQVLDRRALTFLHILFVHFSLRHATRRRRPIGAHSRMLMARQQGQGIKHHVYHLTHPSAR